MVDLESSVSELFRLLEKYQDVFPWRRGRGWGGCKCYCHTEPIVHVWPCCEPSEEEIAELKQLALGDPEAQALLQRAINEVVQAFGRHGARPLDGWVGQLFELVTFTKVPRRNR